MPKRRVRRHEVVQPLDQSYRLIPLTRGQTAIVDSKDFEWLSQWNWRADWNKYTKSFYASQSCTENGHSRMHRLIMDALPTEEIDHRNRNTLDNRRDNLRKCSHPQNGSNRPKERSNASGFKGVWWHKIGKKWCAELRVDNTKIYLGLFNTAEEAAHAYDEAAKLHHGEFAYLNFPH